MSKVSVLRELWDFLMERKQWWMIPVAIFLILLGALLVFSEGTVVGPLIYTLF